MNLNRILEKQKIYSQGKDKIDTVTLSSYEKDFELTFTHNSTAIEGNTLTLMETKVVLEDGIAVGGKELREIYEVVNHKKAYQYVKKCIAEGKALDEHIVKDIHAILTENIIVGGIYRNQEVRIIYQLMSAGFLPVSIAKENRLDYYNALEVYAVQGELERFTDLVAELEEEQLDAYIKLI